MKPLRIGTRGSALALAQSGWMRNRLAEAGAPGELVVIRTMGDRIQDRPLHEVGGKGLFVKEIEQALLDGEIDLAIHSLKDMPALLPPGLMLGAVPRREDPRDVIVPHDPAVRTLDDLPRGAKVATGSLRRQCQLARVRPDLELIEIRGNVDTRLRKVRAAADGIQATVLAAAGIARLGLVVPEAIAIEPEVMLPAVGQGALALEVRQDPKPGLRDALARVNHPDTATCVAAERSFLLALGGDCTTPLGGYAVVENGQVRMRGVVSGPRGEPWHFVEEVGEPSRAREIGERVAELLLAAGASELLGGGLGS